MPFQVKQSVRRLADEARVAVRVAPVEVVLAVFVAAFFSLTVELDRSHIGEEWAKFVMAALLVWPVVFIATNLFQLGVLGAVSRWVTTVVALSLGAFYWRFVLDLDREAEIWRWGALAFGLFLSICLIPAILERDDAKSRPLLWWFNLRVLSRTLLVGGYCLLLFGGLAGALYAVEKLFDLDFSEKIYLHLWSAIGFALFPWLVAAGIPWLTELKSISAAIPKPERLLRGLAYLLVPLAVVYVAILLSYNVRVIVIGEAPKNLLSPLALVAGGLGLVAMFALEPFRNNREFPFVSGFLRFFPLAFLLLVPLAAWALWVRIDAYGVTEFRYLRLVALVVMAVICVIQTGRLVRSKPYSLVAMPGGLVLFSLLASVGPWGLVAFSRSSQAGRLEESLQEAGFQAGVLLDLRAEAEEERVPKLVSEALHQSITSGFRYLVQHHGRESLDGIVHPESPVPRYSDFARLLKLERRPGDCGIDWMQGNYTQNAPIAGFLGGTLYPFHSESGREADCCDGKFRLEIRGQRLEVISLPDENKSTADLAEVIARLIEDECGPSTRSLLPTEALLPLIDADGSHNGQLFLMTAALRFTGDPGGWQIHWLRGYLVR